VKKDTGASFFFLENLGVILRLGCSCWGGSVAKVGVPGYFTHHNLMLLLGLEFYLSCIFRQMTFYEELS